MRKAGETNITHVVFDLDGTLVDSEPLYKEIYIDVMNKIGKVFTDEVFKEVTGRSRAPGMKIFHDMMELDGIMTIEELGRAIEAGCPAVLPKSPPMPGSIELIRHLAAHKIPMAICSGSQKWECDLKLQNLKGITDLMSAVVTIDDPDIHEGKPAPDAFLVTMKRFEVPPASSSNVLVFEDSPSGVRAAVAAGMRVVMLLDSRYFEPPQEVLDRIDLVISSFTELKPEEVGLPLYLSN